MNIYIRFQKSFGHMDVCGERVYHGTESSKYVYREAGTLWGGKQQEAEKLWWQRSEDG